MKDNLTIDRTKLTNGSDYDCVTGRFFSDNEYAEDLALKLRMLGAVERLDFDDLCITVGYWADEPNNLKFHKAQFRFLMGKFSEHSQWQVHPTRVNVFLNGGHKHVRPHEA